MPPREAAPTPSHSWNELINICKVLKAELRSSLAMPFSRMTLVSTPAGCRLYALGTPHGQQNQTLLAADINGDSSSTIEMAPVFDQDQLKSCTPSQEFYLMCERQRASVVSGVTDYAIHPSTRSILVTTGDQVLRFNEGSEKPVSTDAFALSEGASFVFDAQICPSDPSIISYVLNKQIHVESEANGLLYSTSSECPDVSNGVPAFITQEELDRFGAVWWSPDKTRLLYERVDESQVRGLAFACPGKPAPTPMKYPVAGHYNATTEIRLIVLENGKARDLGLKVPLRLQFPWIEYVARAGFLNDGKTVWIQVMNRAQTRSALIVLPEVEFETIPADTPDAPLNAATIIHEEESSTWINAHDTIIPVDSPGSRVIEFICASEEKSDCHLYLTGVKINKSREVEYHGRRAITAGPYSVCKSTSAVVDNQRQLVYYVANVSAPTEWNVCVASYAADSIITKQLTPSSVSFKSERSYHVFSLLPNVGFVCWMTSLTQPQHCCFYSLVHPSNGDLPDARLTAMITLPGHVIPPTVATGAPEIIRFRSTNSGLTHCAMVIRPEGYETGRKYPVVQYVYGGPGIQVVRNDYSAWIPFQKFTKLGYVVVMVDGRGSSNRGTSFEAPIKFNMGTPEVEDQVEGLLEVARCTNGLLDLSRVVIQGWSYGGYMALLALAKFPLMYRGAVAGGAVTDWRLYDTAYTERYLGYPLTAAYEGCSVTRIVEKLPDEAGRLLLLHGLMDENVHFRHTEMLIELMIKHGKPYQLQVYPSERHGVRSADGSSHLDATMLHFIEQVLKEKDVVVPETEEEFA